MSRFFLVLVLVGLAFWAFSYRPRSLKRVKFIRIAIDDSSQMHALDVKLVHVYDAKGNPVPLDRIRQSSDTRVASSFVRDGQLQKQPLPTERQFLPWIELQITGPWVILSRVVVANPLDKAALKGATMSFLDPNRQILKELTFTDDAYFHTVPI